MFLQRLTKLAESIPPTPPGYQMVSVSWAVALSASGEYKGLTELGEPMGKRRARHIVMAPHVGRSGNITPKLLIDNGTYALGVVIEKYGQEGTEIRHKAFRDLIEKAYEETEVPGLKAVLTYLDKGQRPAFPEHYKPEQNVMFAVDGVNPADDPRVIEFWGDYTGEKYEDMDDKNNKVGQCLICGERKPILSRLEYKIKGIPAGQASGTQIISCDKAAFESYGLKNSQNAPTCRECGAKYTKAINWLLSNPLTNRMIRGKKGYKGVYLFWTDKGPTDSLEAFLGAPDDAESAAYMDEMAEGRHPEGSADYPIYILYLSGNGGRASIKMWEETSRAALAERVNRWLVRQEIVGLDGAIAEPMPLIGHFADQKWRRGILDSLAPARKQKNGSIRRETGLLEQQLLVECGAAVIQGRDLPRRLLSMAIQRCSIEKGVDRAQAAILKMMISKSPEEDVIMAGLDRDNMDPAYLCGRLMATLERIQETSAWVSGARKDSGPSIVEKYFSFVLQSPVSALPRLIDITHRAYMSKIKRKRHSAYVALDRELQDLHVGLVGNFPKLLSTDGKGRFLLGYYHQKAFSEAEKRERIAAKARESEAAAA